MDLHIPYCIYQNLDVSKLLVVTLCDIKKGQELFCFYGTDCFGLNNEEWECNTCHKDNKGIFFKSYHEFGKLTGSVRQQNFK